jgi:hypothetical protein
MKSSPGPPVTLGSTAAAHLVLSAWCKDPVALWLKVPMCLPLFRSPIRGKSRWNLEKVSLG